MSGPRVPRKPLPPTPDSTLHHLDLTRRNTASPTRQPVAAAPSTGNVPGLEYPELRLQGAPASPVSISPPRRDLRDAEVASIREASIRDIESRQSGRSVQTSDSADGTGTSSRYVETLPIRSRPSTSPFGPEHQAQAATDPHSRASSSSQPQLGDEGGLPVDEQPHADQDVPALQYHAFDDTPKKKLQKQSRVSHMASASVGSTSSADNRHSQNLPLPRTSIQRPTSTYSEGRGRALSPFGINGSDSGSPRSHARDLSNSRKSPSSRPISYVDLLSSVPYREQVAPGGPMNNFGLQSVVGNAASLLDTNKTLEMYRANVKKTNDAAVQYEFAIFMVNAAKTVDPQRDGLSPAELVNEAKEILQRLADRAYPFAQYYLGDGYFSGLFNKDKPNYDKAFHLFVGASKHGHAEASYRAALCYEFGWGTAKAYPKAIQFFRQAASKNHPGAATRLGLACLRGDMGLGRSHQREGFTWLKRAAESADGQYNQAPYELGLLHLTGYGDNIFKDEAYAAQLLVQSADLGHVQANFLMGQAYENGLYGLPRDGALSVHYYTGAAMRRMPEAMMALCAWYMVGAEPVLDKDENEAYAWAIQAAELGFSKAEYAVGYFTEMGIGCRRDPLEANKWYVRAAEQGSENAKQRLDIIRQAASGDSGIPMGKAQAKSKELAGANGSANGNANADPGKKKVLGIF